MNTKFKSINSVINKVLASPLMKDINISDLSTYVGEAIKLAGIPKSFVDKSCDIKIKNFRGNLPKDLIYIIQTAIKKNNDYFPMRYSTNTFSSKFHEVGSPDFNRNSKNDYSLNNGYIFLNEEEGELKMVYKGLRLDDKGLPMIPDNIKVELAIEWYIKYRYYTILWELGKIPDKVFMNAEKEYDWYIGAAQTAGQLMSIDEQESFANAFNKTILKTLQQNEFFENQGSIQYLKANRI